MNSLTEQQEKLRAINGTPAEFALRLLTMPGVIVSKADVAITAYRKAWMNAGIPAEVSSAAIVAAEVKRQRRRERNLG